MTTPRAPEGGERIGMGDVTYGPGEAEARAALLVCGFPNSTTRSIALSNLILAARQEGATAERARLAGMAPDDMRKLVCHFEDVVTDRVRETERGERYCHPDTGWDTPTRAVDVTSVRTTLLARLAAARGEALEEAASMLDALAQAARPDQEYRAFVEGAAAIRALLAAPPATAGEGVGNG